MSNHKVIYNRRSGAMAEDRDNVSHFDVLATL